jgi:porphobilinogen synthase
MFRTRRLRKSEGIRRLVKETRLSVDDFVYPLFIEEGENIEIEIVSMPGIKRFSLDRISKELDFFKYSCSVTFRNPIKQG